jgi:hypothetical protein
VQCGRAKVRRALTENAALAGRNVVSIAAAAGWCAPLACATQKNPRRVHKTCRRACIPPFDRYRVGLWIRRLTEHGNGIAQKDNGFHTSAKSSWKLRGNRRSGGI